jgi:hypothetical protein
MFPPKGRMIKSVSGLRVKSAMDDQGRAIPTAAEGSDDAESFLHAYDFEPGEGGEVEKSGPPTLVVRYPQDVKRERLQFKLTTLDLL